MDLIKTALLELNNLLTEKVFNWISLLLGGIGGYLAYHLGGYDLLLRTLISLSIIDYITGFLRGILTKKLSSETGYRGIFKKILIFVVVFVAVKVQTVSGNAIPLREMVLVFYICNEGISVLENVSEFIPLPEKLKKTLIQIRNKNDEKTERK